MIAQYHLSYDCEGKCVGYSCQVRQDVSSPGSLMLIHHQYRPHICTENGTYMHQCEQDVLCRTWCQKNMYEHTSENIVKSKKSLIPFFNFFSENRWKKRGITVVPTKFGIAFTATFLNQVTHLNIEDYALTTNIEGGIK